MIHMLANKSYKRRLKILIKRSLQESKDSCIQVKDKLLLISTNNEHISKWCNKSLSSVIFKLFEDLDRIYVFFCLWLPNSHRTLLIDVLTKNSLCILYKISLSVFIADIFFHTVALLFTFLIVFLLKRSI